MRYTAKQKYRGMFENQNFENKTSSGEIGLNIRTHAIPVVNDGVNIIANNIHFKSTKYVSTACLKYLLYLSEVLVIYFQNMFLKSRVIGCKYI